jgi:hypothetical protein
MTASNPRKQKRLMSNGKRNSAPPRPIKPPSVPIKAPEPKAAGLLRRSGAPLSAVSLSVTVILGLYPLTYCFFNAATDLSRPFAEPLEPGPFGRSRVNLDNLVVALH